MRDALPRPCIFVQAKSCNYLACNWLVPLTLGTRKETGRTVWWPAEEQITAVAVTCKLKGFGCQEFLQVAVTCCVLVLREPSEEYFLRKRYVRSYHAANPFRFALFVFFEISLH